MNPETPITLTLTIAEINVVMAGLGEMPYRISAQVIEHIRQQVMAVDPDGVNIQAPVLNGTGAPLEEKP